MTPESIMGESVAQVISSRIFVQQRKLEARFEPWQYADRARRHGLIELFVDISKPRPRLDRAWTFPGHFLLCVVIKSALASLPRVIRASKYPFLEADQP